MYLFRNSNTQKGRRFGIDFEIAHPNYSHSEFKNIIENEHSHVAVKRDPSLRGDESEIIITDSYHTKDNEGVSLWKDIVASLKNKGCQESPRAGFHIHWDTEGMTAKNVYNAIALWFNYSAIIDYALPKERRGSIINIKKLTRRELGKLQRIARTEPELRHFLQYAQNLLGHCRELTINANFKTIEFRKQKATLDVAVIQNWIAFTQNIIKNAINRDSFIGLWTDGKKRYAKMLNTDIYANGSFAHTFRKVFQYYSGNQSQFNFWTRQALEHAQDINTSDVIRELRKKITMANTTWNQSEYRDQV